MKNHTSDLLVDCTCKPLPKRKPMPDHEYLRRCAVRWLTGSKKCTVVLSELHTAAMEIPDAVGWNGTVSRLVECKISRNDLWANQNKPHVRADRGIGRYRYILVHANLISLADFNALTYYAGYGLLHLSASAGIKVMREPDLRETDRESEVLMLLSALRRIKMREFIAITPADSMEDLQND